MVKKAIIPAAGYGTRSLPITKVLPKEMFPIRNKPAIHYIVEEAREAGIEQILIILSRGKNIIVDYFDRSLELEAFLAKQNKLHLLQQFSIPNIQIHYTRQPYARGLGDAIKLAETFVGNDPFAVLLPDDIIISKTPALQQLIEVYESVKCSVLGIHPVADAHIDRYGIIKGDATENVMRITDIVEKPKQNPPSNLAVIGRYIFTPDLLPYLHNLQTGVGGEYQLTDAIHELLPKGVYGKIIDGKRYDIGREEEYIELLKDLFPG